MDALAADRFVYRGLRDGSGKGWPGLLEHRQPCLRRACPSSLSGNLIWWDEADVKQEDPNSEA